MNQENYYRPYRWLVLVAFMLANGASQMLWLNFAPILSEIQTKYQVSELLASLLILCFPLLYVVLSMPSGAMIDRRGYRFTIGAGVIVTAIFAWLRIFDSSFWMLLVGQLGIAAAQPFIVNGITKLSADWFALEHRALATGLGTAGMFAGMTVGMALTPYLNESIGLHNTMIAFAIITLVVSLFFLLTVRENQTTDNSDLADVRSFTAASEFLHLIREPALLMVFIISFLALGFFNGLTTWLELLLSENGIGSTDAGLIGGALILGGIVGSVVIPAISDYFRKRKPFLLFCGLAGLALTYPLCASGDKTILLIIGGLLGFLFLPGYALLLAMSEEIAGEKRAGGAAGVLMLAGNAGGVIVSFSMVSIKTDTTGWAPAIYLLLGILAAIFVLAFFTRESFGKRGTAING